MSTTRDELVVKHIQCSHALNEQLTKENEKLAAEKSAAQAALKAGEDLIPQAVEALIRHGRIFESQRKEAEEALRDPVRRMHVIIKNADPSKTVEAASIGELHGDTEKSASNKQAASERRNSRQRSKAEDDAWRQGLTGSQV